MLPARREHVPRGHSFPIDLPPPSPPPLPGRTQLDVFPAVIGEAFVLGWREFEPIVQHRSPPHANRVLTGTGAVFQGRGGSHAPGDRDRSSISGTGCLGRGSRCSLGEPTLKELAARAIAVQRVGDLILGASILVFARWIGVAATEFGSGRLESRMDGRFPLFGWEGEFELGFKREL